MIYRLSLIVALLLLSVTALPVLMDSASALEPPQAETSADEAEALPENPKADLDIPEDSDDSGDYQWDDDEDQEEDAPSHPDEVID